MYRRDIIPGSPEKAYPIRIPVEYIPVFIARSDSILNRSGESLSRENTINQPVTSAETYDIGDLKGKTKISYTVKSGDNPGYIADWFDISVAELRLWNRIHRNMIRAGQKLAIYVPDEKVEYYKKINNLSFNAKQELSGRTATVAAASLPAATNNNITAAIDDKYIYHTVQRGDNFWTISKQYPGVTNTDIMQLNNITDERSLRAGQKLKIKRVTP
jgi:membrane-bound lytic murein transglycosylase D